MSDNVPLPRQRQCTDLGCEDEKYILDIFSYAQPETRGRCESRKQLFVFITRDVENNRLSKFLQEEQIRLGMTKVYSDRFCWKKSKNDETLIVQMKMEDFSSASEPIERCKIDEMRIPEKVTFTLPSCDASVMRLTTKLLTQNDDVEVLLETEQLRASLPLIPHWETKSGVEHDHHVSEPTET